MPRRTESERSAGNETLSKIGAKSILQELVKMGEGVRSVESSSEQCTTFIEMFEKFSSFAESKGSMEMRNSLHRDAARCYAKMKKYNEALVHSEEALSIARNMKNDEKEILSLIEKGSVFLASGSGEAADGILKAVAAMAENNIFMNRNAPESSKATVSFNLGRLLLEFGEREKAKEKFVYSFLINRNLALERDISLLLKQTGSPLYEKISAVNVVVNDAKTYESAGDYKGMENAALAGIEKAICISYKTGMVTAYYYLALGSFKKGETEKAKDYIFRAESIAQAGGDDVRLAAIYRLAAKIAGFEGERDKAVSYLREELALEERSGNMQAASETMKSIEAIHADMGNAERTKKQGQ